jgi:hypothetical protein
MVDDYRPETRACICKPFKESIPSLAGRYDNPKRLNKRLQIRALCWIFKQSMGARNRVGIGLSDRPARLAEMILWNQFLVS